MCRSRRFSRSGRSFSATPSRSCWAPTRPRRATSIPEAAGPPRNWDYRYCWLRDGYFVVDALNRLGATETMEGYLGYIVGIVAGGGDAPLQPVYRINGDLALGEGGVKQL